jgi:hypothetical protein
MYIMTERGLLYNGRRVPRLLHYDDAPQSTNQDLLDILCHWFRGDIDPERRALAIYQKSPDLLRTRFGHNESSCISDEELEELVTIILLRAHDQREAHIELVSGCRRDTLRLQ